MQLWTQGFLGPGPSAECGRGECPGPCTPRPYHPHLAARAFRKGQVVCRISDSSVSCRHPLLQLFKPVEYDVDLGRCWLLTLGSQDHQKPLAAGSSIRAARVSKRSPNTRRLNQVSSALHYCPPWSGTGRGRGSVYCPTGTRRFSSSNQFSTTLICVASESGPPSWIITNRWASGVTL